MGNSDQRISPEDGKTFKPKKNVAVCLRLRPFNRMERRNDAKKVWEIEKKEIRLARYTDQMKAKGVPSKFSFDYVFGPDKDTCAVFERSCLDVIKAIMVGYHGCIFAYGQTSSGKTFTINGNKEMPGVCPRSIAAIFQYINECTARHFMLKISYLECYNEVINDLLNPKKKDLRILVDAKKEIFVEGLTEQVVSTADEVFAFLDFGEANRHIGRTDYNAVSSRSHTIFQIHVESSSEDPDCAVTLKSTLNIVDLAGSENTTKVGIGHSSRIKETGYINKSLLTLGHCIYKLSEKDSGHVPFRDSKLTRILKSALSGKACITILCSLSPAMMNVDESLSTLKFATRAKRIKNSAKVNETIDPNSMIIVMRKEINRLKILLKEARESSTSPPPQEKEVEKEVEKKVEKKEDPEKEKSSKEKKKLTIQIESLKRILLGGANSLAEEGTMSKKRFTYTERIKSDTLKNRSKNKRPGSSLSLRRSISSKRKDGTETGSLKVTSQLRRQSSLKIASMTMRRMSISRSQYLDLWNPPCKSPTAMNEFDLIDLDGSNEDILYVDSDNDDSHLTELEKSQRKVAKLQKQLTEKDEQIKRISDQNKKLKERLVEAEETLAEWDQYYVQNQNKEASLQEWLKTTHEKYSKYKERSKEFEDNGTEKKQDEVDLVDFGHFGELLASVGLGSSEEKNLTAEHNKKITRRASASMQRLIDLRRPSAGMQFLSGMDMRRPSTSMGLISGDMEFDDLTNLVTPQLENAGLVFSPDLGWTRSRVTSDAIPENDDDDLITRTRHKKKQENKLDPNETNISSSVDNFSETKNPDNSFPKETLISLDGETVIPQDDGLSEHIYSDLQDINNPSDEEVLFELN